MAEKQPLSSLTGVLHRPWGYVKAPYGYLAKQFADVAQDQLRGIESEHSVLQIMDARPWVLSTTRNEPYSQSDMNGTDIWVECNGELTGMMGWKKLGVQVKSGPAGMSEFLEQATRRELIQSWAGIAVLKQVLLNGQWGNDMILAHAAAQLMGIHLSRHEDFPHFIDKGDHFPVQLDPFLQVMYQVDPEMMRAYELQSMHLSDWGYDFHGMYAVNGKANGHR